MRKRPLLDPYQGVAMLVRVKEGSLPHDCRIRLMSTGSEHEVSLLGVISPEVTRVERVACGEVGVLLANVRDPRAVWIGDTVTEARRAAAEPLPGFRPLKPMVWSGLYPADPGGYDGLRSAIEKLQLSDSSLSVEPETSEALGFGFRCGYLGLLHMEVVQERLEREYSLDLIPANDEGHLFSHEKDVCSLLDHRVPSRLARPLVNVGASMSTMLEKCNLELRHLLEHHVDLLVYAICLDDAE